MSLVPRRINLPNEMILEVSKYLSNQDYLAFKCSCKQVYSALNHSKRETLSKKNNMKLCIRALLTADQSIPKALFEKSLQALTFFELELLDKTVIRIVSNNFTSLKFHGRDIWKKPNQICNLAINLASINEKEALESLFHADTTHEIREPFVGHAFGCAASSGHHRVVKLLLSNPSEHSFFPYFLERGLIFSSLNKHSSVVKEILEDPRVAQVRDFAFSRAFSLSTVWVEGTSPTSEGFTNSFHLFLESDKIKAVGVEALYEAISNLMKFRFQASADALLESKRVQPQSFAAILSRAISSKDFELFRYLMLSSKKSLLSFSGFKKALLTSCKESAVAPYFFLVQHPLFERLSKNDLQGLLEVFGKLPLKKQNEDDTLAIHRSVFETFCKKVEN